MKEPKFEIGDKVIHESTFGECAERVEVAARIGRFDAIAFPKLHVVTHVFIETCFGGETQITYSVEHADSAKRWSEICIRKATDWTEYLFNQLPKIMDKHDVKMPKVHEEPKAKGKGDAETT